MIRFLVIGCAIVGCWFLINTYLPSASEYGFVVQGFFVSVTLVMMLVFGYLAYKGK